MRLLLITLFLTFLHWAIERFLVTFHGFWIPKKYQTSESKNTIRWNGYRWKNIENNLNSQHYSHAVWSWMYRMCNDSAPLLWSCEIVWSELCANKTKKGAYKTELDPSPFLTPRHVPFQQSASRMFHEVSNTSKRYI